MAIIGRWILVLSGFVGCWSGAFASALRVDDLGTGVKNALIAPAAELKDELGDFYQAGGSQFGIRNSEFQILYNLLDQSGRQAGFANISAGETPVYDQRPSLVINTAAGQRSTQVAQERIFQGGIWSSGYYRDFQFRPFVFNNYGDAIGSFHYHAYSDRLLEETRLAHAAGTIGNLHEVYVEYPIAFSSYQVYQGAGLTPVTASEIANGAVVVRRPNGSLLGFTFPSAPVNGRVEIVESGGQLLIRHFANHTQHVESIRENTRVISWGRRLFAAASHDASRDDILRQMREELNPLPSGAFTLERISPDSTRYTQWVEPVHYDRIRGYYRYRTEGVPWGTAVRDLPNKYAGVRVRIQSSRDPRSFYMMQETTSPDTAAVLQDDYGFTLPVSLGIARSLGGQGNPDWTGDFGQRDPFMALEETRGWGRSLHPVRLEENRALTFRSLHVVHNWGVRQVAATGSVVSHVPLFTSNVGVWCSVDLKPWPGSTGDFRGFSSTVTQWAWGQAAPGNEEQFAGGIHFFAPSIGDRAREYKGSRTTSHSLSHFRTKFLFGIDNGKADLAVTYSALPDTRENRILVDVELTVNQDMVIGSQERINLHSIMSDHMIFYNGIHYSTPHDTLVHSSIGVPPGLNQPSSLVQTTVLGGSRPAYALMDKRWAFDPNTQYPTHETFARQEANIYVQVFEKDLWLEGQPANHLPLALRVGKKQPDGGYWDQGQFKRHGHYVTYDLVVEKGGFTLKAGDSIRVSYMVMAYGGKASNNEITSARETHERYVKPEVLSATHGNVLVDPYPWVPVVRSTDGSSAEFRVRGGRDVMTIAVEGLHSYKPVALYRIDGGNPQAVVYSVNGYDGYRSYIDPDGLIGISIPVDMNEGAPATFRVEQDNSGVPPPGSAGPRIGAIAGQTIEVNTSAGPIPFTINHDEIAPGLLTLAGFSSNTTLIPDSNIIFGGSGENRTVTVTPVEDQVGSSTITVIVGDGEWTADTSFLLQVLSDASPAIFDFGDGARQGWTEIATDGQGRQFFALVPPGVNSPHNTPHSGDHFIGLHIPAFGGEPFYTQDGAHDTLVMRSPEFRLHGEGDLTAWLSGGGAGSVSLAGTSDASLPSVSSTGGFLGVALRNVTTGTFVLSASKSGGGNEWEEVAFTEAQLAALPREDVYTLDLIDARHGGWGWVNMDSVTIPGTLLDETVSPEMLILMIRSAGEHQVRLSWPAAADGWTLQSSPDADGEYIDAALQVSVEGDEKVAYDTHDVPRRFYRLKQTP